MEQHDPADIRERLDPSLGLSDALNDEYDESEVPDSQFLPFHGMRIWQTVLLVLIMALMVVAIVYFSINRTQTAPAQQRTQQSQQATQTPIQIPTETPSLADELADVSAELYKWRYHVGGQLGPPTLDDEGRVYVHGMEGNNLFAIDDGELSWSYSAGGYDQKERLHLPGGDTALRTMKRIVYLDGNSGTELWSWPAQSVPQGARSVVPSAGPFTDSRGNVLTMIESTALSTSGPSAGMYRGEQSSSLVCLSRNGEVLWEASLPGRLKTNLIYWNN